MGSVTNGMEIDLSVVVMNKNSEIICSPMPFKPFLIAKVQGETKTSLFIDGLSGTSLKWLVPKLTVNISESVCYKINKLYFRIKIDF